MQKHSDFFWWGMDSLFCGKATAVAVNIQLGRMDSICILPLWGKIKVRLGQALAGGARPHRI
jgi:hypothetical protein